MFAARRFATVAVSRATLRVPSASPAMTMCRRAFSEEKLEIPRDAEHQAGRRKDELDAEAQGLVGFNTSPIVPDVNAGTKENPILVPSGEQTRVVGYEDPSSHQLVWFNLEKGPLHYIPEIGLYFKLDSIGGGAAHH